MKPTSFKGYHNTACDGDVHLDFLDVELSGEFESFCSDTLDEFCHPFEINFFLFIPSAKDDSKIAFR